MKPLEALERAFLYISGLWSHRLPEKPGAVIEKLNAEQREALTHLKSDDIGSEAHVDRWIMAGIEGENWKHKSVAQALRDEKMLFDSKMKK